MIDPNFLDLLERPIVCSLATLRPDGSLQVNPMWFRFDGEHLRFSHTNSRAKYRNLLSNPAMTVLIVDPQNTQRYVEIRGKLTEVVADPTGSYHQVLAVHYGYDVAPPSDAAERVILVMSLDVVNTR